MPFSDFSPDLDSLTRGSVRDMLGFYPTEKGFATFQGLKPFQNALPGQIVGSNGLGEGTTPAGQVIAALYNKLFMSLNGGPFVAQPLAFTNATNRWRFTNYGNDLIGVNGVDAPVVSTNNAPFALLGGNPSVFSLIQATDFSVIGVVPDSQEWYSTLVDTNWTPNIQTETIQAFITSTPGNIIGLVALRGGVTFFKQNAFHYGVFTGPPYFWNVQVVSHQTGTWGQECVVPVRDVLYFWGTDDFYMFDGYSLNSIPNNLREAIFADANRQYLPNVAGYYNHTIPLVSWHYSSNEADPPGSLDSYVCLNIRWGTWGFGRQKIDYPLLGHVPNAEGVPTRGLFLPDHTLRYFDPNAALGAPYITGNDIGDGHYIYEVQRARPRFNKFPATGNVELQMLSTYVAGKPLVPSAVDLLDQDGWFNGVRTDRLQRPKLTVHDQCEIVELELDVAQAGEV